MSLTLENNHHTYENEQTQARDPLADFFPTQPQWSRVHATFFATRSTSLAELGLTTALKITVQQPTIEGNSHMQTTTIDKTQKIKEDTFHQEPVVVLPNSGEQLTIAGSPISHKVKSKDTNGVFSVMEFVTPPGKGVALHVHEREDELVYLLEGEIEVTLGDQKMKAVPGVLALLPRGIPHGFTNVGNKPSRLLDTILPGQFDNYFVELAGLFTRGEPSQEQNDALSRKYRIKYL